MGNNFQTPNALSGRQTGTKTQYGRPIWLDPNGDSYSERTTTVRAHDGQWYNVPTVGPNGAILPQEFIANIVLNPTWKPIDPITKARMQGFNTVNEAVAVAKSRSANMRRNTPAGLMGM